MAAIEDVNILNLLIRIDSRRGSSRIRPNERELLNSVEELDLSDSSIYSLPKSITELKQLKKLDLSYNGFSRLPNRIGEFKNLESLILSHNNLNQLPATIGNLQSLTYLDIRENGLTWLPDSIKNLQNLKFLYLEGNQITDLQKIQEALPETELDIVPKTIVNKKQASPEQKNKASEQKAEEKSVQEKADWDKVAQEKAAQEKSAREKAEKEKAARELAKAMEEKAAWEKEERERAERERKRKLEEVHRQQALAESILENVNNQNMIAKTEDILKTKNLLPDEAHNIVLVKRGKVSDGQQPVLTYMDCRTGKTTERLLGNATDNKTESSVYWDVDDEQSDQEQWFACELDSMTETDIMNHMPEETLPYMPIKITNAYPLSGMGDQEVKSMIMSYQVGKEYVDAVMKHNPVIFHGAPGTGKTYSIRKIAESFSDDSVGYSFVQFHPSYDYTDFVEGLRPVCLVGRDEPTFVRMDGIFKAFCRKIVEEGNPKKKYFFIVDEINRADLSRVFGELMFGLESSYRGKDYRFHTQYENLVTYQIIRESTARAGKQNIGKGKPMENDCFQDGFYIPENLVFIGIMNDIDRSVESLDFALRRRFHWVEIKANDVMERMLTNMYEDSDMSTEEIHLLAERIINMNQALSTYGNNRFGLTDAYHVGPAYFKNLSSYDTDIDNALAEIFEHNIASLIKEYTRGRSRTDVERLLHACAAELEIEYGEVDNE